MNTQLFTAADFKEINIQLRKPSYIYKSVIHVTPTNSKSFYKVDNFQTLYKYFAVLKLPKSQISDHITKTVTTFKIQIILHNMKNVSGKSTRLTRL